MKVLFSCAAAYGHFHPLVPLARAFVDEGHEVAFATSPLVPRARWAHGGSGSILATFAAGLPTLLVPQGADQFENAGRCADLGAGLALMPGEVTGGAVRDAVATLLEFPAYRHLALDVAAEIAAAPEPRDVARRLGGAVAV